MTVVRPTRLRQCAREHHVGDLIGRLDQRIDTVVMRCAGRDCHRSSLLMVAARNPRNYVNHTLTGNVAPSSPLAIVSLLMSDDSQATGTSALTRRAALSALGTFGAVALLGACAGNSKVGTVLPETTPTSAAGGDTTSTAQPTQTTPPGAGTDCDTIPAETAGPFPGDGSNGKNILTQDGVVRKDIRASIGSASGVADGVPVALEFTIVDGAAGCSPLEGAAVYVWHCDRDGNYSMYSQGTIDENYLRGVQVANGDGIVSFTSIFPGDYAGRWPHVHFEVYPDLASALAGHGILATSQLAFPEEICNAVYATEGYAQSRDNLALTSLTTDGVFRDDGAVHQLATMRGSVESGLTATLAVAI